MICLYYVTAELNGQFPVAHPVVHLKSIYHQVIDENEPFVQVFSFPYSPRWSCPVMVEKIRYLSIIALFVCESMLRITAFLCRTKPSKPESIFYICNVLWRIFFGDFLETVFNGFFLWWLLFSSLFWLHLLFSCMFSNILLSVSTDHMWLQTIEIFKRSLSMKAGA